MNKNKATEQHQGNNAEPNDKNVFKNSMSVENNGSTKKSHQVMNENSRKDIIQKNSNNSAIDSV